MKNSFVTRKPIYLLPSVLSLLLFNSVSCTNPVSVHNHSPESVISDFAAGKKTQMEAIASRRGLSISPQFKRFFDAAVSGDWKTATNSYVRFAPKSYQFASKQPPDPSIANELWEPVHETYWAYQLLQEWKPSLLALYAETLLDSLPEGSVFFAGTDPGRFITTAYQDVMDTPDIYIITQNALANRSYLEYIEDIHGSALLLPSEPDRQEALRQYLEDVQSGKAFGFASSPEGNKLQIDSGTAVMGVNGLLAKEIFDKNNSEHEFYVEESYVIPWMYHYLVPHGPIMKLQLEPLSQLPQTLIAQDMSYWKSLIARLQSELHETECVPARSAFAKMRSAIAGLYVYRGFKKEAEEAFKEALTIFPDSSDANFRLAEFYIREERFSDACTLLNDLSNRCPSLRTGITGLLEKADRKEKLFHRQEELRSEISQGKAPLEKVFQLGDVYLQRGNREAFKRLMLHVLDNTNVPPQAYLGVAKQSLESGIHDILIQACKKYLERDPSNQDVWTNLAAAHHLTGNNKEAINTIRQSIELHGQAMREILRNDKRFAGLRHNDEFRQLLSSNTNVKE